MNVAIIPARGGSKRIPRKNIRDFCGQPMMAWSIQAAKSSGLFERVLVSTDDDEIRELALDLNAETPFVRPRELANDHAGTLPVIRHALQWLVENRQPVTLACCIYATAPFLEPADLIAGHRMLTEDSDLDFSFSVTRFGFPVQRALKMDSEGHMSMFQPEHEMSRSQDLVEAYHDAGQFYWGTRNAWLQRDRMYSSACRGVVLPPHRVQDIDTYEDWTYAELKFRTLKNSIHE